MALYGRAKTRLQRQAGRSGFLDNWACRAGSSGDRNPTRKLRVWKAVFAVCSLQADGVIPLFAASFYSGFPYAEFAH